MEHLILLSLSSLIIFLIHFTFFGVSCLTSKARKSITEEPIVPGQSSLEQSPNKLGRPPKIFIPRVLARWPWSRLVNPHYAVVKKEADEWVKSFQAFRPGTQDAFDRINSCLLACLCYPTASKEHVRAGCDFNHFLFTFDDHSDLSTPSEVRELKNVIMDAFRNPHTPRPKDEWIGGEVARQFWERTIQNATAISQKRFVQVMDEYLEGVVQESIHKQDRHIQDIESYLDLRRRTGAVKPAFVILELGLDIPDDVMSHPAIQEMVFAAVDIIILINDMVSYDREQRHGDDLHNVITCVMNEHHTDVNGAMLWVEDFLAGAQERFMTAFAALPEWEDHLNPQVKEYCNGLGQWVRANDDWSFEGERYFGAKGLEIKEKRWMSLLPKKSAVEVGPTRANSSLL